MNKKYPYTRQTGAAMVVALIMLLVLTLLATASARMTILEEMMTGNTQDRNVAFQAAEAALRAGEDVVADPTIDEFDYYLNAGGLYEAADPDDDPLWNSVDWESNQVLPWDELEDAPGSLPNASAGLIVEQLPPMVGPVYDPLDDETYYRVTARGVGVSGNAVVTLQSTFKR